MISFTLCFYVSVAMVVSICDGTELMEARDAKHCLRNKRLTFIGDSLTRYQYVNLAHLLSVGDWEWDYLDGTNEHKWDDWFDFFYVIARINGCNEICDCYRRGNDKDMREHHYYRNEIHNISISMHLWFGDLPIYVGRSVPTRDEFRLRCSKLKRYDEDVRQFVSKVDVNYDIVSFLDDVVSAMTPDILVLNQGFWPMNRSDVIMANISAAAHRAADVVVWKTTTAPRNKKKTDKDIFLQLLKSFGVSIFDAYTLTLNATAHDYWNVNHFSNNIYSELNSKFLKEFVCPMHNN